MKVDFFTTADVVAAVVVVVALAVVYMVNFTM